MEKFKKEARRIRKFNNPHIVRVHDIFPALGTIYYVMDFIEGESLARKLARQGCPMREEEVMELLPQVLDALQTIHADGLWHLDIKPDNLMLDKDGTLRLIDFGASKQDMALGTSTMMSAVAYTEKYAPIEQVEQNVEKFGPWTDFYALGATLLNLLTNSIPPNLSDILDDPSPGKSAALQIPNTVSEKTRKLIAWMMQYARAARPQSVGEIRAFLGERARPTIVGPMPLQPAKSIADSNPQHAHLPSVIRNLIGNMVHVEGGTFSMGSSDGDSDEKPIHQVTLSAFSIGRYEVTQEEWQAVMGSNPSFFNGTNLPVERVSWNDCQTFIHRLNQMTGMSFRLPTEAEWEFAARGGNKSLHYKYSGSDEISSVAWYWGNSGSKTHPVGQKSPNELGIYDMSGNVWEWCVDWYGRKFYKRSPLSNPNGPAEGSYRVGRGGGWSSNAGGCRVSNRGSDSPADRNDGIGLRLAL